MTSLVTAEMAVRAASKLQRILRAGNRMIVVSAMPKSGSTFLTKSIAAATGYRHSYLACAYGNVDQELYLPKIVDAYGRGTVTQQHFKANEHNLELLQYFGITPVVLVRNIFDVLVSARDHLVHENLHNLPGIHVAAEFLEFDRKRQMDFVVDFIAPWHIGYFASWCRAEANGFPFQWMSYEESVVDWPRAISRVLEFYGVPRTLEMITRAVETLKKAPREKTRINQGIVGRGLTHLSAAQQDRVVQLTRYYNYDFSRIGIDRPVAAAAMMAPMGMKPAPNATLRAADVRVLTRFQLGGRMDACR